MSEGTMGISDGQLRSWLVDTVARHLRRVPTDLDPTVPLAEYGLDSISALAVAAEIDEKLGLEVGPAVLWEYPTIAELLALLTDRPEISR